MIKGERRTFILFMLFSAAVHIAVFSGLADFEQSESDDDIFIPLGICPEDEEYSDKTDISEPDTQLDPEQAPGIEHGRDIENPDYKGLKKLYLEFVRKKIEENKFFPDFTRHTGMLGNVLIGFTINRRGEFVNIHILRSSGQRAIDKTGLNAVMHMKTRIKRPAWAGKEELKVRIVIKYQNSL